MSVTTPQLLTTRFSHPAEVRSPGFFVAKASVLALLVAVGFAPSFYLRPYLETGATHSLPTHVHVHGMVLTCSFMLFLTQTLLVAARRAHLHRLLGVIGAGIAIGLSQLRCWS